MLAIRQAEDDAMRWLDGLRAALEPYPWAYTLLVLAALLLLAKIERSNIINIIEGVRYHLDPSDIRLLLKY